MKRLLALCSLLAALLVAGPASATERCAPKTNLTTPNSLVGPTKQLATTTAGWFQWLNRSYLFNCSGTTTSLTCSYGSEVYTFSRWCNSVTHLCYHDVYDSAGLRNTTVIAEGNVSSWTWNNGPRDGRLTITCDVALNIPSGGCSNWRYATCD